MFREKRADKSSCIFMSPSVAESPHLSLISSVVSGLLNLRTCLQWGFSENADNELETSVSYPQC